MNISQAREEKERRIAREERETAPMGQSCRHGRVPALCRSMEIYQSEWGREMELEEERKAEGGSQEGD